MNIFVLFRATTYATLFIGFPPRLCAQPFVEIGERALRSLSSGFGRL
jgi:hypothetical protein